jgi:L-aminoadipate-semialdehyde dehydrogenase
VRTKHTHRYRFSDYFADVIRFGYDLRLDEYIEWRDALEALTLTTKDNALYPLLHFVLDDLPTKSRGCTLVCGALVCHTDQV